MNKQTLVGKIARTWKVTHDPTKNTWLANHDQVGIILAQRHDDWTENVDIAWCDGTVGSHWIQEIEVLSGNNKEDRFSAAAYSWTQIN